LVSLIPLRDTFGKGTDFVLILIFEIGPIGLGIQVLSYSSVLGLGLVLFDLGFAAT